MRKPPLERSSLGSFKYLLLHFITTCSREISELCLTSYSSANKNVFTIKLKLCVIVYLLCLTGVTYFFARSFVSIKRRRLSWIFLLHRSQLKGSIWRSGPPLFIYLFISIFGYLFVCLFTYLLLILYIYLFIYLVNSFIHLFTYLSIRSFILLSISLSSMFFKPCDSEGPCFFFYNIPIKE